MVEARVSLRVKGHLHLVCARGTNGASYLREQSFRAPLHLSKPHEDQGSLVANLVNPTAGIFDDDEIAVEVLVERDASLVLTTPSASRIYRSRQGGAATMRQTMRVEEGAFLEYFPEPFIPHAGARYHQKNELRVAKGGSLVFFEWLAPGRVASGEVFQFDELCWDTDAWLNETLVARERYTLNPSDDTLSGLRLVSDTAHYLGCFVMGDIAIPRDAIHALRSDSVYPGCGPLTAGGWSIKVICRDALSARSTMQTIRALLYAAMGRVPPRLGRF